MEYFKNKKVTGRFYITVLLLVSVFLPITTTAQTPRGSYTSPSSQNYMYWDWSTDSRDREEIREYRRRSNELRDKINALPTSANQSVLMPVLFGIEVSDIWPNFGDPRSDGRVHEGEDIIAISGTPIVSPTPAVVLRTGVGTTQGNYVYTANPGGETFVYMHLDRIGEGVVSGLVLSQGELIGYVGNTGNASGGPAHLHFEIHNDSGDPIDPFPRLTGEFSLQEKISYLSKILTQTSDSTALSQFLVTNFRSTFTEALAVNITLPSSINDALASVPVNTASRNTSGSLPAGDLSLGSTGSAVVTLQKHLIQADSGPASARLATAGATGYFGTITKASLVEYQTKVGITPTSGYYGPITRAFIGSHPLDLPGEIPPGSPSGTLGLSRDLNFGKTGEDVRTLQRLLNANGFTVTATGAGSSGNETDYFGPATEAAVKRFQSAHGITPVAGYVGPITRAALAPLLLN